MTSSALRVLLGPLDVGEALSSTIAFLHWYGESSSRRPEVIAVTGGTATDDVRAVARTALVYDPHGWTLPRLAQRFGRQSLARRLRSADLRRRLRPGGPLYVADPAAARLLRWASPATGPVLAHLHASGTGLDALDAAERTLLVERADRWIAGSGARRDELLAAGVDAAVIHEAPDLLDHPAARDVDDVDFIAATRRGLLAGHGIPLDAPLVVAIGNVDWWNIPDAFVRVAWEVNRRRGDAHFLWVADGATERMLWPLRHDIAHAGLEAVVHVDTSDVAPWRHVAAADVLMDTRLGAHPPVGRRDAAMMGVPTVAFGAVDRVADRVAEDLAADGLAVRVVDHLDVEAMATAVLTVLGEARDSGARARSATWDARWYPPVGGAEILGVLSESSRSTQR